MSVTRRADGGLCGDSERGGVICLGGGGAGGGGAVWACGAGEGGGSGEMSGDDEGDEGLGWALVLSVAVVVPGRAGPGGGSWAG